VKFPEGCITLGSYIALGDIKHDASLDREPQGRIEKTPSKKAIR
jgi:hypothetical protein